MPEPGLTADQRQLLADRARGCCEYCMSQARFSPDPFSIEHIFPRSQGGSDEPANFALSCQGCNNHKYTSTTGVDPVTGHFARLFHPREDHWADHFTWNEDFSFILGLTSTGRATVEKLHLNRAGVVNLRKILHLAGEHPPRTDGPIGTPETDAEPMHGR